MTDTKKIDNGGPAFARPGFFHDGCTAEKDCEPSDGMSLRDWFAGKVLASVDWSERDIASFSDGDLQKMAGQIYRISDAMLAARKAGEA